VFPLEDITQPGVCYVYLIRLNFKVDDVVVVVFNKRDNIKYSVDIDNPCDPNCVLVMEYTAFHEFNYQESLCGVPQVAFKSGDGKEYICDLYSALSHLLYPDVPNVNTIYWAWYLDYYSNESSWKRMHALFKKFDGDHLVETYPELFMIQFGSKFGFDLDPYRAELLNNDIDNEDNLVRRKEKDMAEGKNDWFLKTFLSFAPLAVLITYTAPRIIITSKAPSTAVLWDKDIDNEILNVNTVSLIWIYLHLKRRHEWDLSLESIVDIWTTKINTKEYSKSHCDHIFTLPCDDFISIIQKSSEAATTLIQNLKLIPTGSLFECGFEGIASSCY
jgi:hypothetical protein